MKIKNKKRMNIKEKVLAEIEKNEKKTLGVFAQRDEYLKIFKEMESVYKNLTEVKDYPENLFEDFNFEIYTEDYNSDIKNMDEFLSIIPSDANIIFMINGYFSKEHSKILSKGITVYGIKDNIDTKYLTIERHLISFHEENEQPLSILNSLLTRDGVCIIVEPNIKLDRPIYLFNVISELDKNYFINSRKLIRVEDNSEADIVEIDLVYSKLNTIYSEIFLLSAKENSNVNYSKMYFKGNDKAKNKNKICSIKNCSYKVENNGNVDVNNITLGNDYSKNDTFVLLDGNNSALKHSFFALNTKDRIIDLKSKIYHNASNTQYNQFVKVIANDKSKMYFDGKIIINKDAGMTFASQNSKGILLSNDAKIHFQPHLEIYNDDIKATHGSTVGNLDDNLLFYLNQRGIDDNNAKKLLLTAFATDIINQSKASEELKKYAINEITSNIA